MERRVGSQKVNKEYMYFTEGNAVRKVSTSPKKKTQIDPVKRNLSQREVKEIRRSNREYRTSYRENENAFTMSVPYVIFLSVAVVMVVLMCIKYLNLNSEISTVKTNISNLETKIDTISAQNDAIDYEINGYIDVENVLKVAREELGMVNASKEQIRYYESSDTEYMKQYNDIPGQK
jgi:cell division protein FtsL